MKLINLDDKNKAYFLGLDPFEILDKKLSADSVLVGAAAEEDGEDVPVGLMLCILRERMLMIRWLYVEPKYRGQGYGDALLSKVFEMAEGMQIPYVGAYLPQEYGRSLICPDEEGYFRSHAFDRTVRLKENGGRLLVADVGSGEPEDVAPYSIFDAILIQAEAREKAERDALLGKVTVVSKEEETIEPRTVTVTASEVAGCAFAGQEMKDASVCGLGDLTIGKLGRGLQRCKASHPYMFGNVELDAVAPEWFDSEYSSCALENDEVCGLFLVHRDENGAFWAEYLYDVSGNSKGNLINMLKRSAGAFVRNCPKDAVLNLRLVNAETEALVKKIFGK